MRHRLGHLFCLAFSLLIGVQIAAAQSGATVSIKPVPPRADPPSDYPPGTTITGQEIILGSVPARVWLEIYVTGWEPENLKLMQVQISATDPEGDGGGYRGANADCIGQPANGGNLIWAAQPCSSNADCRKLSGPRCAIMEATRCVNWDGVNPPYLPAGRFCVPVYQNPCHPHWPIQGLDCASAVDLHLNTSYGLACDPEQIPVDYHPSYVGTLVLDVPGDAKGTYTIDFHENQSSMQNDRPFGFNIIPIHEFVPAKITVPCGRCCYWGEEKEPSCVDHVSANECARYDVSVFQSNEVCPQDSGAACPACAIDAHCNDGVFCNGAEFCDGNGQCQSGDPPCKPNEKCKEKQQACKHHGRKLDHK